MSVAALGQGFEAASVKTAAGRGRPSMGGGPGTGDPGQITYSNASLMSVAAGIDVTSYPVSGPEWLTSATYDVTAKIPEGKGKAGFEAMLRNLLAALFDLQAHQESRELSGFELVAAQGGAKLKRAREADAGAARLDAPGLAMMEGVRAKAVVVYLSARAQPVSALVERLSREFRMPVEDKTGLPGNYGFTLEFAPLREPCWWRAWTKRRRTWRAR
jgi:uncharacterized protein (TIGR03435 family)